MLGRSLRRTQIRLDSLRLLGNLTVTKKYFSGAPCLLARQAVKVSELDKSSSILNTPAIPLDSECLTIELGLGDDKKRLKKSKSKPRPGEMISYVYSMVQKYPDSVVLTRVGSFYEIYFHQAVELGPMLNLRIGRKNQRSPVNGDSHVPMAGFPFYQLQAYLKVIVGDLKKTVVLLDQVASEVAAGSNESEKRPVTRIISAGTLVGESFLNASENNFIAAVHFTNSHMGSGNSILPNNSPVGIAWLDISVGTFYYQLTTVGDLMGEIVRINPKEILLDSTAKKHGVAEGNWFSQLREMSNYMITYKKFPASTSFQDYISRFSQPPAEVLYAIKDADEKAISAMTILLKYLSENIPGSIMRLKVPEQQIHSEYMKIDSTTRKSLELFESTQNGDAVKGTLYNVINRTVTQSGARMLRSWLSSPLLSIDKISKRQDLVEYFYNRRVLATHMAHIIQRMDDCQRTIQKLGMQRFDAMDLVGLARSISIFSDVHQLIKNELRNTMGVDNNDLQEINQQNNHKNASIILEWYETLNSCLEELQKLARSIENSIDIELLEMSKQQDEDLLVEGYSMDSELISPELLELQRDRKAKRDAAEFRSILKPGASRVLKNLRKMQNDYLSEMKGLDKQFKDLYPSLKVSLKWAPQYGYHIHITGTETKLSAISDINKIDGHQIKPTKKTIIIQNDEWIQLGLKKDFIQSKREAEEQKILNSLRESAVELADSVRNCCNVLDQIDVTASLAFLAHEQSLVRPTLVDNNKLNIVNGRHMTVEAGLKSSGIHFTSNDCHLGGEENSIWVITGPNMGGKSTFIRQVALITVLAQIGCFVPASSVTVGLVDRIFCRVGAGDDLYRGRSTFMVEMLETSNILKNATSRSLAILDEVGRGTSGRDGLAISYATLVHLLEESRCRSLYATHFGAELGKLLEMENKNQGVSFYRTRIRSDCDEKFKASNIDGIEFFFDHKLEKGISQNSHGLKIAALAGFPPSVLTLAETAWRRLSEDSV